MCWWGRCYSVFGEGYEFLARLSLEIVSVEGSQSEQALAEMEDWTGLLDYSGILGGNLSGEIDSWENKIRALKEEVKRLSKEKNQLQQARDLIWQTYMALLSKEQELDGAQGSPGTRGALFLTGGSTYFT